MTNADRGCLEEATTRAAETGVEATTELLRGSAVDEIVAHADTIDADLIVVASRGRGALAAACSEASRTGCCTRRTARCWSSAARP